jgi:hypothetical protein
MEHNASPYWQENAWSAQTQEGKIKFFFTNRNILHTLKKEPLNIMLLHTSRTMDGPWIKTVHVVSCIFDASSSTGVAEPPELSRLKCAGHHHKRQHRLKRTSNGTILGLSGNVPIQPPVLGSNKHTPHEGESKDITTTILQHRQSSDYKPVQTIITKPTLVK